MFDKQIILGSSSKGRASILKKHGVAFTIMKPEINEKAVGGDRNALNANPSAIALAVAHAKADALLSQINGSKTNHYLLALDQVVSHQGAVREKPVNAQECRQYMNSYAFGPAETHSALVVVDLDTKRRVSGVDVARQHFKTIDSIVIEKLIQQGDILGCAGGFMIDSDLIVPYLDRREGDEDSIIGMPLALLKELILKINQPSAE